ARRTATTTKGKTAASGASPGTISGGSNIAVAAPGKNAQGVTDKDIQIGVIYADNAGAANAAIGAAGVGQIDSKRAWDALFAELNAHGGIAGRKAVPVF